MIPVPSYPALDPNLEHHNFVGELLFWTAVYNFPQEMITFLLSMLPDNDYKVRKMSVTSFILRGSFAPVEIISIVYTNIVFGISLVRPFRYIWRKKWVFCWSLEILPINFLRNHIYNPYIPWVEFQVGRWRVWEGACCCTLSPVSSRGKHFCWA